MPFAITLCLDPAGAAFIEHLWRSLAAQGIDSDRRDLGYAPHITLAIYPDDVPIDALQAGFEQVTAPWQPQPVTLSGIGVFPGPISILWAAPVVTHDLLRLQASVSGALPDLPVHPHYRPNVWVPHITLTGPMTDPGPALAALLPHWRPTTGRLVRTELVSFRPVKVLRSRTLATADLCGPK
jgi:2'-5' RNA ligase